MTIASALRSRDFCSLKELAHQLNGSAGLHGFIQIAAAAHLVHQQADEEADMVQLQVAVDELVGLCQQAFAQKSGALPEDNAGPNRPQR